MVPGLQQALVGWRQCHACSPPRGALHAVLGLVFIAVVAGVVMKMKGSAGDGGDNVSDVAPVPLIASGVRCSKSQR